MIPNEDNFSVRERAFLNVLDGLAIDRRFPEMVFLGIWSSFLFFGSDRVFASSFADVMADFLRADNSCLGCLLNITETYSSELNRESAIYMDPILTGSEYQAFLRGNGPATGWLYSMDRFGCASDRGEWEIYCEKDSDIAVVGFRHVNGTQRFSEATRKLRAAPIESLRGGELAELFPFSHLSPEWQRQLFLNYRISD